MNAYPDGVFDFTLQLTDEGGDEVMEWFAANYGPSGTGETDALGLRAFQAVIFKGRPGVVPPGRYALRFDPNQMAGVPGFPGRWRFIVRELAEF